MVDLNALYQAGDWAKEKHVPVIEVVGKEGNKINIKVSVGKQIAHPNTTAHFIAWIDVYFHPDGSKFPYQIGKAEFSAHGASTEGADKSTVYTEPVGLFTFKTDKPGTILALSCCNIHGLWRNELKV
jgi:superoxide reductase